jgi:hypothetical protein
MIVQLRLGPEYGSDDGMGDRDPLIDALTSFLGESPSTDSGGRTTNIKCWDIPLKRWDEVIRFTLHELREQGLLDRATVARLDYVDPGDGSDYQWGEETVVWPENLQGKFEQWPDWGERLGGGAPFTAPSFDNLKTVIYPREGELRLQFRIPEAWGEGRDDPQGGLYYPIPEGGGGPGRIGGLFVGFRTSEATDETWNEQTVEHFIHRHRGESDAVRRVTEASWLIYSKGFRVQQSHRLVEHKWRLLIIARPELLAQVLFVFETVAAHCDKPGDRYYCLVERLEHEMSEVEVLTA